MSPKKIEPSLEDFIKLVLDLRSKPDADIAIIGGSFLDIALQQALLARFVELTDKEKGDLFFLANGPLFDLGSKIGVAYALNVISRGVRDDLVTIARLRNRLAHRMEDLDANSPSIRNELSKLAVWKDPWTHVPGTKMRHGGEGFIFEGQYFLLQTTHVIASDPDDYILFFVPGAGDDVASDPRLILLHGIWSCLYAIMVTALRNWNGFEYTEGVDGAPSGE
ncbi:hypothetical protein SCB71_14310 [Herbiconiux sp. KACC 21604]|uniref:hypothetical protein n=1 Tax=unclassified Herbiconiux TaxID=2618217 RepID=UPI0014912E90|nr:hypothetical protein [Herbiconiux sp. SALV-R1]QJU54315.1 hypothetical protein HL652_12250 [Herbiconiux sp. SALV-R1]WPO85385.1 hypothetical protein SCB71_14310 [Herbiconiux sp. KACC 21604]